MTENDPDARRDSQAAAQNEQVNPEAAPTGPAGPADSTVPEKGAVPEKSTADSPSNAQTAPEFSPAGVEQDHQLSTPQSAQQEPVGGTNPYEPPSGSANSQTYAFPRQEDMFTAPAMAPAQRSASGTSGRLLVGVALIAAIVGGIAGGASAYVFSDDMGNSTAVTSLDKPQPAKQTANAPAGSVEAVAEKLSPSVVQIRFSGRGGSGEGSGFILSPDGYILTNNHVVEGAASGGQLQVIFQDGKKVNAKIIGRDPSSDIAVVKAEGVSGLTPVEIGRSDDLKVGQGVVAIGSPFDLVGTVTSGIVSSLHRPVSAEGNETNQATVMDAVQTDAAINPGNSGGPLANMAGQVIGINSAIYSPQSETGFPGQQSEASNVGIGFAIPIDQARRTADDIIKNGKATQTFIGASTGSAPQGGALLGQIVPGSPAEKAGLKAGDVVVKLDDRPIDSSDTLVAAIRTRAPGETVKLTLADGRVVEATLSGQPVEVP